MMQKVLFVYNPVSSGFNIAGRLDHISGRLMEAGMLPTIYRTSAEEDGFSMEQQLADLLSSGGYSKLIVSGGDGTVNSIVNILMKSGISIPIGILPTGTANDFARSIGIPKNLDKSIEVILHGNQQDIDIGVINSSDYFVNTCAGGIFMDITYSTNRGLKKNIGPFAYYLQALGEMSGIKPFKCRLTMDSQIFEDDILLFLITNGRHAGGFSNINRFADVSDGIMDIVVVRNCPTMNLAGLFIRTLGNGLPEDKYIANFRGSSCLVESETPVFLSVDGEKGPSLPIYVNFLQGKLKVFVPDSFVILKE